MEILCSFRLVLERKTGKEIPESSRFEFLEKFLANNFALSDAEDNTSGPLNRGGIADLPLLRTLLAIRQKSREPSFWEVMDSFVLVAYASLAANGSSVDVLLKRLLSMVSVLWGVGAILSQFKISSGCLCVLCESKELGGKVSIV